MVFGLIDEFVAVAHEIDSDPSGRVGSERMFSTMLLCCVYCGEECRKRWRVLAGLGVCLMGRAKPVGR